jgi:hypothetical protein
MVDIIVRRIAQRQMAAKPSITLVLIVVLYRAVRHIALASGIGQQRVTIVTEIADIIVRRTAQRQMAGKPTTTTAQMAVI